VSDRQITNDRRAVMALSAISTYARISPSDSLPETYLRFDSEREPGERAGDQGRLADLLCGLMHYAERRDLSFTDALTQARRQYSRQRTSYLPRDAVQRTGQARQAAAGHGAPLTGEIIKARPGRPPAYEVDFITSREWVRQPDLAPARPFPVTTTRYGQVNSAYIARHGLVKAIRRIEAASEAGNTPDPADAQDLDTFLTALCGWSGLERPAVLGSFSTVLTEHDGHLLVTPASAHPAALAATSVARPPTARPPVTRTATARPSPTTRQSRDRGRR
jgi:hypothetical protein